MNAEHSPAEDSVGPPRSFWIISVVFLIWNLLGLMAFVMQVTMSEAALAALPEAQQELYRNTPSWVNIAFAVAVIGGTLGCVLLLMRKSLAGPVFLASLLGVLAQLFHIFILSPALEVMGAGSAVMPSLVIAGALFLVLYSRKSVSAGWLS